jgi:hypothetical protein
VPGSRTRVASEPLSASASATAAGRGSARPCLTSLGTGGGLLVAASALRSSLPLFDPPEQKSSSSPLPERATACRSSVFRCSAGPPPSSGVVRTCGGGTGVPFCNGTLNASVFVHCGCRGLNMYVVSARSRDFSSFSSTKTRLVVCLNRFTKRESPRVKVTSEVSVSRRRRSPSARSALSSEASLA